MDDRRVALFTTYFEEKNDVIGWYDHDNIGSRGHAEPMPVGSFLDRYCGDDAWAPAARSSAEGLGLTELGYLFYVVMDDPGIAPGPLPAKYGTDAFYLGSFQQYAPHVPVVLESVGARRTWSVPAEDHWHPVALRSGGAVLCPHRSPATLVRPDGTTVALAPFAGGLDLGDGRALLLPRMSSPSTPHLIDTATGATLETLGYEACRSTLTRSGAVLLTKEYRSEVAWLWHPDGSHVEVEVETDLSECVAAGPDLLVFGFDGAKRHRFESGDVQVLADQDTGFVGTAAASPSGEWVAVAVDSDLWLFDRGGDHTVLPAVPQMGSFSFLGDDALLVGSLNDAVVLSVPGGERIGTIEGASFRSAGNTAKLTDGTVAVWNDEAVRVHAVPGAEEVASFSASAQVRGIVPCGDGRIVVYSARNAEGWTIG